MQFNLVEEAWIPVKFKDGEIQNIGLRALFRDAHSISAVVHSNPLAVASLLRLALAIVYRVYRNKTEKEWKEIFKSGAFDKDFQDYLDAHISRFDLYSEEHPFFQIAGFTKEKANSVKKLSPEFATANNKTLFSHLSDNHPFSIPPSEAAVLLLVCQYFSLGGGISGSSNLFGKHSNYANSPLIGGAVIYARGKNLFETLLLNYAPLNNDFLTEEDLPVWEQQIPTKLRPRALLGMSDYLTWPSRYMRLLPNEQGEVSELYIAQGLSTPPELEREPYFAYRTKKDGNIYPLSLRFGRALWRDAASIYYRSELTDKGDLRSDVMHWLGFNGDILDGHPGLATDVVALENNKANPLAWHYQSLPLYIEYLIEDQSEDYGASLQKAIRKAELMHDQVKGALRLFCESSLPGGARKEEVSRMLDAFHLDLYFWPYLDQQFPIFFSSLIKDYEQAPSIWDKACRKHAKQVFEQVMAENIKGSGRDYESYAKAKKKLYVELFGENAFQNELEYRKEVKMNDSVEKFVGRLLQLNNQRNPDLGALANLRRTLSGEPSAWLGALQYIADVIPDKLNRDEHFALVAGLYALHRKHARNYQDLGVALAKLIDHSGKVSPSLALRFTALLESSEESLPHHLRSLFDILKSKEVSVDYVELTNDLLHWGKANKAVQLKWARSFWAPTNKDQYATNEQGEG